MGAAFLNTLKRVSDELQATKDVARYSAGTNRFSFTRMLASPIERYKPFGGDAIVKGITNMSYGLDRADTALGALARGSAEPGSDRYALFTKVTNSYIPQVTDKATGAMRVAEAGETPEVLKVIPRASITAPLEFGGAVLSGSLTSSAINDALSDKSNKTETYPQNI